MQLNRSLHFSKQLLSNVSLRSLLFVVAVFAFSASLQAQLPQTRLTAIFPLGGQVGTTVELRLASGTDLDDSNKLVFSHPGITAVQKTQDANGKKTPVTNTFIVTVAASVPPGLYDVRASGVFGLSNPRTFVVSNRKESQEVEPNENLEQATVIELNSVVNAASNRATDVDFYKFAAKKGQRVLVDCRARRIDSQMTARLELYNTTGRRLIVTREIVRQDPFIDFTVPADGEYLVKVHDVVFGGGANHVYRLAVHTGPHIDYVLPPAGLANTNGRYTLYGRNLPGGQPAGVKLGGQELQKLAVNIALPADSSTFQPGENFAPVEAGLDGISYSLKTAAGVSNPVTIYFATAQPVLEIEPNNVSEKSQKISIPAEFIGQFQSKGDVDYVQFEAKAGAVHYIEVFGQRNGTSADPYFLLQGVTKNDKGEETVKQITLQDDVATNLLANVFDTLTDDPIYRFQVPADGTYRIAVRDRYYEVRGDASLVYRLSIRNEQPDFRVVVLPLVPAAGAARTAQTWATGLRKGDNIEVHAFAFRRDGFNGAIEITAEGLPNGVTCQGSTIPGGQTSTVLVFSAAENAPDWAGQVRVVGKAVIDDLVKVRAVTAAAAASKANAAALPKLQETVTKAAAASKVAADKVTPLKTEQATKDAAAKAAVVVLTKANQVKDAATKKSVADAAILKTAQAAKVAGDKANLTAQAVLKTATTVKAAADKKVVDSQAIVTASTTAKTAADKQAAATSVAAKMSADQAAAAKKAADAAKDNKALAAAATKAAQTAATAAATAKTALAAKTAADAKLVADNVLLKTAQTAQQVAVTKLATATTAAQKSTTNVANLTKAVATAAAANKVSVAAKTTSEAAAKITDTKSKAAATAKADVDKRTVAAEKVAATAAAAAKTATDAVTAQQKKIVASTNVQNHAIAAQKAAARQVSRQVRSASIAYNGAANVPGVVRVTRGLGLSVLKEKAPFQLQTNVFKVDVNQSRQILVPVKLIKRDGFDNNVTLTFVGVPAKSNITVQNKPINKGKTDELLQVFVKNNAPPGTYTLYLKSQGQVAYRRHLDKVAPLKAEQAEKVKLVAAAAEVLKKANVTKAAATKKSAADVAALAKALATKTATEKANVTAQAALKVATDKKTAADKQVIATQAVVTASTTAKAAADKQATATAAAAKTATDQAAAAKKAADAAKDNKTLAAAATKAAQTAATAATTAKTALAAKTAADKKLAADNVILKTAQTAQAAAVKVLTTATLAAQKTTTNVTNTTKVFTTAGAANKVSLAAKTKADAEAKDADTKSKAAVAAKTDVDKRTAAAVKVATAKNINFFPPSTPIIITVKKAPVTLAAVVPAGGALKIGAKIDVKVTVKRVNGFQGPLTLSLPLPPNVKGLSAPAVTIPADKTEGVLSISAAGGATEGQLANMVIRGSMSFEGQASVDVPVALKVNK